MGRPELEKFVHSMKCGYRKCHLLDARAMNTCKVPLWMQNLGGVDMWLCRRVPSGILERVPLVINMTPETVCGTKRNIIRKALDSE